MPEELLRRLQEHVPKKAPKRIVLSNELLKKLHSEYITKLPEQTLQKKKTVREFMKKQLAKSQNNMPEVF